MCSSLDPTHPVNIISKNCSLFEQTEEGRSKKQILKQVCAAVVVVVDGVLNFIVSVGSQVLIQMYVI
mgnify:CR=1 FL=1